MSGQHKMISSLAVARLRAIRVAAILLLTASVPAIGASPAFALDSGTARSPAHGLNLQMIQSRAGAGIQLSSVYTPSSPVMADPCLPLLDNVRQTSDSATYRIRRPAGGQAAPVVAIGYVLGLRHAPGPKETLKDDINRAMSQLTLEQSHALAVSNYRRCRSELELGLLRRE